MKSDRPGQPFSTNCLSGRNDDNSAMFSLKTLAAKVDPTASSTRQTSLEDSGVIDLKKLLANTARVDVAAPVSSSADAGLFALPESTLVPQMMETPSPSNDRQARATGGHGRWFAAAMLIVATGAGTMIALHARSLHAQSASVLRLQSGVAAAARAAGSVALVEAHAPPAESVVPKADETKAADGLSPQRSRRSVVDRSRKTAPAVKQRTEVKQPASEPCDLLCEIRRRAQRKKP